MELTLSPALPEDAEQLCALFIRYSRELENYEMECSLIETSLLSSIQSRIKSRVTLAAVAKDGEKVVGFLFCNISRLSGYSYEVSPLFGYISDTYVLPEYRGQNAAGRLADMACRWLRENEVGYVELKVLESNSVAHRFWANQGFAPTTRVYGMKLK